MNEFTAAGVRVLAVSPEPVDVIAAFTSEHGVTFPVLSDADSGVIRAYGILNTLIDPDEPLYGLPFPGSYLTDGDGRVTAKFFNQRYQEREAPEIVIHDGLGLPVDLSAHPGVTGDAGVSAVLASPLLTFQQKTALLVRLELEPGLHAYGRPIPDGYIATTVTVTAPASVVVGEPTYPATRPFRVEGLNEAFHVFEGTVEIEVPLLSSEIEATSVPLELEVQYQACDEHACYMPRTVQMSIDAPVGRLNRPPRRG